MFLPRSVVLTREGASKRLSPRALQEPDARGVAGRTATGCACTVGARR